MKQILLILLFLAATIQAMFSCSCILQTYCELKDEIVDNERALVFKGFPIKVDTFEDWTYAVQFEVTKIYQGEIITPDSPLYNGEAYANTESTVWLLAGNSATCLRYFEEKEAIVAVFYSETLFQDIEVSYIPTICRADYFPIADDGTVSGNIWSHNNLDVVPLEQFEQVILSNCRSTSTSDISIQDINIELYPQPTSDYLNIKIESALEFKISLYDVQGKEINDVKGRRLDTSGLNPGVYLLSFAHDGKRQVKKFVKM